jgi:hypothetical protein
MDLGTTRGGHKLTPELVYVLYNEKGLKTGFFNTEFNHQYSWTGSKLRSNSITGKLPDAHVGLRNMGEWYEDYFRVAHFIDSLTKSKAKDLSVAADEAAAAVRKYHFDYSDFTNFEKQYFLRVFPFYKWTRKALPLMTTMLFTKPGKVMAYPKIMNTLGNALTTGDMSGDVQGFAPDYSAIIPGFIQDMWAYQLGDDEEQTWLNIATPQMDSYKALTNPGNVLYGLLNPLLKIPDTQIAEQVGPHWSIGDLAGSPAYDYGGGKNSHAIDSLKGILKMTPQTNFAQKTINDSWNLEDILGFGTGLGFYESDPASRQAEMIDREGGSR